MPTLTILGQKDIELDEGANLLTFLQDNGWDQNLPATCGGRGTCATCAVRVAEGGGEPNASENAMLKDRVEKGWRLSCQIDLEDDLVIEVPGYEVADSLEIDPEMLVDILEYCLDHVPLAEIPSSERIDAARVMDLRRRAAALVDGGGDSTDFKVLSDLLIYLLRHDLLREIPSPYPFTVKTIDMMLQNFATRIPEKVFV